MTAAKPPKQQPSTRQLVRAPAAMEQNPPDGLGQRWFAAQGWQPFGFQQEVWQAVGQGQSGLLHATTGAGKTYAVWLAALARFVGSKPAKARGRASAAVPLTVLWVTPMRALAADTERALLAPLLDLGLPWTAGVRSGDTSSSERQRQSKQLPTVLITTPESLSLLLSGSDAQSLFAGLGMVVVDEWHELIGNKRGVQLQLALARLRRWRQGLITWGLSATLGNVEQALEVLVPNGAGLLVQGKQAKTLLIDTLLPSAIERFPWAGHLGLRLLPQVVAAIGQHASSLVFTNTRAQAELWYQALIEARPDWSGLLALHHGSLDRSQRDWVELALKDGRLKAVICTSSLDLGVDFLPVEQVLQIGSAKGIARLLQRAGRSGHAPGRAARLTLVPTHSLELIEAAAAQDAIASGQIEARNAPEAPLDVLVQHLVTIALGGGFYADELFAEVRSSHAYRSLSDTAWQWALAFVAHGGSSLQAYPDYHRARPNADGLWQVPSAALARRHRMAIGTIVSEATMALRFWSKGPSGKSLGSIEERFIARLKPGDHLLFGGRRLELVRVHEMTAFVRPATGKKAAVPRWSGGRMPLSTALAEAMLVRMDEAADGVVRGPEMQLAAPLLALQAQWSALPSRHYLLAEGLHSREGWHLFLYPFAGRNVHLGLASLLALRLGRTAPNTFSIAVNDYGFELLALRAIDWQTVLADGLFSTEHLLEDVVASLNVGELAQRRFREIARIAGLVFHGYPGAAKSTRQVQASAQLFFEVLQKYDPDNPLLHQARREVLGQELDVDALADTLRAIATRPLRYQALARPSPMAFPLLVERLRETASTEHLSDRIARMVAELEQAADAPAAPRKRMRKARSM